MLQKERANSSALSAHKPKRPELWLFATPIFVLFAVGIINYSFNQSTPIGATSVSIGIFRQDSRLFNKALQCLSSELKTKPKIREFYVKWIETENPQGREWFIIYDRVEQDFWLSADQGRGEHSRCRVSESVIHQLAARQGSINDFWDSAQFS